MTYINSVKLPFSNAVGTWLMAADNLASSSVVSVVLPFLDEANAFCSTGMIASVATGMSALAPSLTWPLDS